MNYHDKCPHCGHKISAYTLHLNEGLVVAFIKFVELRTRLRRPVNKGEIELSNSQYSNFQNLRHFGLIDQVVRGQAWEVTGLGWMFYLGQATILTPAAHMDGVTLEESHLAWSTHARSRRMITIHEMMPEDYKRRPEFQAEKAGV